MSPDDTPVRVAFAEDSFLVREGTAALLREVAGIELVAAVADVAALLDVLDVTDVDVVITDIRMPPTNTNEGIVAARQLRATYPGLGILVLSQHLRDDYVTDLLADGAEYLGYLLKERVASLHELQRALHLVAEGGSALDPLVIQRLVAAGTATRTELDELTEREREVLDHMAQGKNNASIARSLFLTERAVEKHINSLFHKLGLSEETDIHRRVMAVLAFLRDQT